MTMASKYEKLVRRALAEQPYDGGRELRSVIDDMKSELIADSITKSETLDVWLRLSAGTFDE
jgi:hypothetical protein